MLCGIPYTQVEVIWPRIEAMIADAVAPQRLLDASDVLKSLLNRDAQLWIEDKAGDIVALAVTEIITYPKAKVFNIRICTGSERETWEHYMPILEAWALSNGCIRARLVARPGWKRVLKEHEMTHIVLEKDL